MVAPMRRALVMNPKMSQAHAALGDALVNLGQHGEAKAEYAAEPIADFRLTGLAIAAQARNPAVVGLTGADVELDLTQQGGRAELAMADGRLLLRFGNQLSPNSIPSTVVVDTQGRIAARVLGEATEATLVALIEEVAAGT